MRYLLNGRTEQDCPRCVGEMKVAERLMFRARERSAECTEDAIGARRDAHTEERRAHNEDVTHRHTPGGVTKGSCTLESHGAAATRFWIEARDLEAGARAAEAERAVLEGRVRAAARRTYEGCDLCGRSRALEAIAREAQGAA